MSDKKHAVVIGVSAYQDVVHLNYADKDARDVRETLRLAGFEDDRTVLLNDGDAEAQPERVAVFEHLGALKSTLDPNDTLLFYFSGHGISDGRTDYLLPIDARKRALKYTALAMDEVVECLLETGSRQVVMIIDACRDALPTGKGVHAIGPNTKSVVDDREDGVAVVFSCQSDERSFEIDADDIQQSAFTHCLLEAIRSPGISTLRETADHLAREVQVLNGKYNQLPQSPYLLANPQSLEELLIFSLLGGEQTEIELYMDVVRDLRDRKQVSPAVCWAVVEYLLSPAPQDDAFRMSLVRDLCQLEIDPPTFERIWKSLSGRAASQRTAAGPATSVGGLGVFPTRKGDGDGT